MTPRYLLNNRKSIIDKGDPEKYHSRTEETFCGTTEPQFKVVFALVSKDNLDFEKGRMCESGEEHLTFPGRESNMCDGPKETEM